MAFRQHFLRLAMLVGLSTAVQCWVIAHAVVPAQDSIRYLAAAQAMQRDGWWPVVREANDPPGYTTLVYGCSELLSAVTRVIDVVPERLLGLRSLQLAAAIPLVLSLAPLYVLLVRWIGSRPALYGCLLFCVTSGAARLGADGVSDSLQLLCMLVGGCGLSVLLTSNRARSPRFAFKPELPCLLLVGCAIGCGMLVGSIALALLPAVAIGLMTDRSDPISTLSRRGARVAVVMSGFAVIVVAYALITAGASPAAWISRLRGDHRPENASLLNFAAGSHSLPVAERLESTGSPAEWRLSGGEPMAFGHKEASVSLRRRGILVAVLGYGRELAILLGAPILALGLFGLWRGERTSPRADRYFAYVFVAYSLIAIVHAARAGYLSDRHLLPLLPVALAWAGRGVVSLGSEFQKHSPWATEWADAWPRVPAAAWFSRRALVCTMGLCLLATVQPLHSSRWGHRQAAEWLATTVGIDGAVLDTRGWTALYSGRLTYRHEAASTAIANAQLAYIVVDERELVADSLRGRTLRELLTRSAERLVSFTTDPHTTDAGVALYRWHPERFAEQIKSRPVRE